MATFDYVIVGAGSAGSILAARLSEDGRSTVCLIEAGGADRSIWFKIPVGYAKSYYDPAVNWMYWSEPEKALGDRKVYVPRGKVQGGSGSINAMIFVRGDAADFDGWAAAGNQGWSYQDVLPYFRKLETHADGASQYHGADGPIHITPMRDQAHPITGAFLNAADELGLRRNRDFNGADIEGVGVYDINTRRGQRCSSSAGYLRPALKRQNLARRLKSEALRLVLDESRRATGVVIRGPAGEETVSARREVILAAGAVGTPKLLQLSGIGSGADLQAAGIPVRHELPAVGHNLQDHLCASFYYRATVPTLNDELGSLFGQAKAALRYFLTRRGPLALSVNQAGAFLRGNPDTARPNIQLYFNPLSYRIPANPRAGLKPEPYSGYLIAFNACRPSSRGQITVRSPDAAAAPAIMPNYLATEHDRREAIEGCHLMRRIAASHAIRAVTEREMAPSVDARTDEELLAFFRENCGSIYHLCGTAGMGPDPQSAVVDHRLRVHGITGLRVVDASIFPTIPSGNINAPTMMVAEKGAEMIRAGA